MRRDFFLLGYLRKTLQVTIMAMLIIAFVPTNVAAQAFSQNALNSIIGNTPFFNPNAAPSCYAGGSNATTTSSTTVTNSIISQDETFLGGWAIAESGGGGGEYNLLNSKAGPGTTLSGGVKNYPSYKIGIQYTVELLQQSDTSAILAALKQGSISQAIHGVQVFYTWKTVPLTANLIQKLVSSNSVNLSRALPSMNGIPLSKWSADVLSGLGITNGAPTDASSSNSCICSITTSANLTGNTNAQKAYNFYIASGLPPAGAAALVGNFTQESNVDPTSTNSIGAHGIAQWYQGRLQNLITYAQSKGVPEDALSTQLSFSIQELQTSYQSVLSVLKNTSSSLLADTTTVFQFYENAYANTNTPQAKADLYQRYTYAQQILKQFGSSAASIATTAAVSGCGNGSSISGPGGCVNPFSQAKNLGPERIDMGVDYAASAGSPILAMCNAKVLGAAASGTGWVSPVNTQACVYLQITSGPYSGKTYYVCEDIAPTVTTGETVTAGQEIATFLPSPTGLETGWGSGAPYGALATQLHQECTGSDPGCWSTAAGVSFNKFLVSTGAPSGIFEPGAPPQSMPAGYP